jgi:hypothetical protein
MTIPDDHRAQLLPRLADLIMALTNAEVIELASLLDAMARRHGHTGPTTTADHGGKKGNQP